MLILRNLGFIKKFRDENNKNIKKNYRSSINERIYHFEILEKYDKVQISIEMWGMKVLSKLLPFL